MSLPYLLTLGETMALVSGAPGTRLQHGPSTTLGIGGAESNVAIGVRRLGVPATWVGRVGHDSLGALVLRELAAEGVLVAGAVRGPGQTGLMVKERSLPGRSQVWYYRAGSAGSTLAPEDLDADLVRGAGALHVTGITPGLGEAPLAAVREAVRLAAGHGVPVSFDVNHRVGVWRDRDPGPVYRELAAAASVVFAGPEEAALVIGAHAPAHPQPTTLLDALAELTDADLVLKLGADGCLARVDGADHRVPARSVSVVDTVGAGDAFVAGYLAALLQGRPPADRLADAVTAGAFACLSPGDWEGYPMASELAALEADEPVVR